MELIRINRLNLPSGRRRMRAGGPRVGRVAKRPSSRQSRVSTRATAFYLEGRVHAGTRIQRTILTPPLAVQHLVDITLRLELQGQFGPARLHDLPISHDVDEVRLDVI